MIHKELLSVEKGLDRDHPALRLYEKAKRLGIWNPTMLDFREDRDDWLGLKPDEQDVLLRLTSMFQAGEEAVTLDLLPLILVIAREGRIEEEMFLTTFLFEEAKHTDFFSRVLQEVAGQTGGLGHYHSRDYRTIFYETLPETLSLLLEDASPAAQIKAAVTYNMIVEGVLAETGYHAFFTVLDQMAIMPGVRQGITLLKQDESRHIAYGIFLISRLLAGDPDLWDLVELEMNRLLPAALNIVGEIFDLYDPMPFDLQPAVFIDFALGQFQKRVERLEKARSSSIEELFLDTAKIIDTNDS